MKHDDLADWAKIEVASALHTFGLFNLKPKAEPTFFYMLSWESFYSGDHGLRLCKIGITCDIHARLIHHRTHFPGWKVAVLIEARNAKDIEDFWKSYFSPFQYNGSQEVFIIPPEHRLHWLFFLSTIGSMSYFEPPDIADVEALRKLDYGQRILKVLDGGDFGVPINPEPSTPP